MFRTFFAFTTSACVSLLMSTLGQLAFCQSAPAPLPHDQPTLVFRNGQTSNLPIRTFDKFGLTLDDGQTVPWHAVLRGRVDAKRQGEFDGFIHSQGLPVYRLNRRLKNEDWAGAERLAGALLEQYAGPPPAAGSLQHQTRRLVADAASKLYLKRGQFDQALVPFLMTQPSDGKTDSFPIDSLPPFWFSSQVARRTYQKLQSAIKDHTLDPTSPIVNLYLAALEVEQNRLDAADAAIENVGDLGGFPAATLSWKRFIQWRLASQRGKPNAPIDTASFEGRRLQKLMQLRRSVDMLNRFQQRVSIRGDSTKTDAAKVNGAQIDRAALSLVEFHVVNQQPDPWLAMQSLIHAAKISTVAQRPDHLVLQSTVRQLFPETAYVRNLHTP